MTPDHPTRAMLLTPPGAGAIGVVRLSGPQAEAITQAVFRAAGATGAELQLNHLHYGSFIVDGTVIDDVVCSRIEREGEIALDICAHGGVRIIERILSALASLGAEVSTTASQDDPCWPIRDMIQYEAAVAMSLARTERAVRFLACQYAELPGVISEIAHAAETDPVAACDRLSNLVAPAQVAHRLITGATVALVGPTNAGKSTLFNRLVGRHAVVVSSTSGTTRDWVREPIEINGVAVDLIDTAGIHPCTDPLETTAIADAQRPIESADLRLIVVDGAAPPTSEPMSTIRAWMAVGPYLVVQNKADLPPAQIKEAPAILQEERIALSALTGMGLDSLAKSIVDRLGITPALDTRPALFCPRQAGAATQVIAKLSVADPKKAGALVRKELLGPVPLRDR